MSESTAGRPAQPKIASFAPELIDEILDHLVHRLEKWPAHYPGLKSLGTYSLISRNWRGPVQRRISNPFVIKSGTQAERIANGVAASDAHVYVRRLELESTSVRLRNNHTADEPDADDIEVADGVTLDHFVALLLLFPNVTALSLDPAFTHFRPSDINLLQSCQLLSCLSSIAIHTQTWHHDVELIHDLLTLTPNLTSLCLSSIETYAPLTPSKKSPVILRHFEELYLFGGSYASALTDLALLSPSTISQINKLAWHDDNTPDASALPLLKLMGPTLKLLEYTTFDDSRDFVPELEQCVAVEHLTLNFYDDFAKGILPHLPTTTHTVTVPGIWVAQSLLAELTSPPTALKKVTLEQGFDTINEKCPGYERYKEEERDKLAEVVQACKRGKLELVARDDEVRKAIEEMG